MPILEYKIDQSFPYAVFLVRVDRDQGVARPYSHIEFAQESVDAVRIGLLVSHKVNLRDLDLKRVDLSLIQDPVRFRSSVCPLFFFFR